MISLQIRFVTMGLSIVFGLAVASCSRQRAANDQQVPAPLHASQRMLDGRWWLSDNLTVNSAQSYCYDNAEENCRRYGRLYTWESAQRGCHSLGEGWRLPTNDEWRQLAKHYGGVRDDSEDGGKAAFRALRPGGSSGFMILFSGGRAMDGEYARLEAHGFYWTVSESDSATAWFYNFGQAGYLNRHSDGEKQRAFAVRCVRD